MRKNTLYGGNHENVQSKKHAILFLTSWFAALVIFGNCVAIWGYATAGVPLEDFLDQSISYKVTVLLFTGFCLIPLLILARRFEKNAQMGKTVFFATAVLLQHGLWIALFIFDSIKPLLTNCGHGSLKIGDWFEL